VTWTSRRKLLSAGVKKQQENMKKTLVLAAAVACLFAALPTQANLVVNGGFETGSLAPWQDGLANGNLAVVTGNAHDGSYVLQMSSTSEAYQTLTLASAPTMVDFFVKATGAGTLSVVLDGVFSYPSILINATTGYSEYITYTTSVAAGPTELSFLWNGGDNKLYLDDVSVTQTPVPEPTPIIAGALLLLPFGASALRILRKTRTA
jgi:hypothetical protein